MAKSSRHKYLQFTPHRRQILFSGVVVFFGALFFQNCADQKLLTQPPSTRSDFNSIDLNQEDNLSSFLAGPSSTPSETGAPSRTSSFEIQSQASNVVTFKGDTYRFSVGPKNNLQLEKNNSGVFEDLGGVISGKPSALVYREDILVFVQGGHTQDLWVRAVNRPTPNWGALGNPSSSSPLAIVNLQSEIEIYFVQNQTIKRLKLPQKNLETISPNFVSLSSVYLAGDKLHVEAISPEGQVLSKVEDDPWRKPPPYSLYHRSQIYPGPVSLLRNPLAKFFWNDSQEYDQTFWIRSSSEGKTGGTGTETDPFLTPNGDLDSIMKTLTADYLRKWFNNPKAPRIRVRLSKGTFLTKGFSYFTENPNLWTLPSRWTLEGSGMNETTIRPLVPHYLPLAESNTEAISFQIIMGHSPGSSEIKPHDQIVRNLRIEAGFSRLAPAYKAKGKLFNTHGILIYGDNSGIENVRFEDFGALAGTIVRNGRPAPAVYESFVAAVSGSHMRSWPEGTSFGPGWITDCIYEGIPHELSTGQVTIFGVAGGHNKPETDPLRKEYVRRGALLFRNRVLLYRPASDLSSDLGGEHPNHQGFQGFSFFRVDHGIAAFNETLNAGIGYYTDFWHQRNIVIRNNRFLNAANGIAIHTAALPNFHEEQHFVLDNLITLAPVKEGGRAGIRVTKYQLGGETWNYYEGQHRRNVNDFSIEGNYIFYAKLLKDLSFDHKFSLFLSDLDGLRIRHNLIDEQLLANKKSFISSFTSHPVFLIEKEFTPSLLNFGFGLLTVQTKEASGKLLASYPIKNWSEEQNSIRATSQSSDYCRSFKTEDLVFANSRTNRMSEYYEQALSKCTSRSPQHIIDGFRQVSPANGEVHVQYRCVPIRCLGLTD